jgi:hypothetical protein
MSEHTQAVASIFVLTVLLVEPHGSVKRQRTWGWFPTLPLAEEAVLENHGDMYEDGYYNMAILEEFAWGASVIASTEHWFSATPKWEGGRSRLATYDVKRCDKPRALAGVVNFGMG